MLAMTPTIVAMPVVLVLAYLVAVTLDSALGQGTRLMRRARPGRGTAGTLVGRFSRPHRQKRPT